MSESKIGDLIRRMEDNFITGTTAQSKYVSFSMHDTIEKIDAYLNSKHISGDTDSLGREKPFFNIVVGATNIWYRATDIDRKDIKIKANKQKNYIASLLYNVHLQNWMKKARFGVFLNDWGRTLSKYGTAMIKFVTKKGELYIEVIPFNRAIFDSIDFEHNPKIEKLYFTEAQLKQNKAYDQDVVNELIEARKTARKTLDGQDKDYNNSDYIEVYELHGNLEKSHITERESDDDIFVQQMHVLSYLKNEQGEYEDYCLLKGREAKDPYMLTHLIKEDGRTLGIGAVEYLFDAQWMSNYSAKSIKDQLDLASKIIFQTSDATLAGNNVLTDIENGDIILHADNAELTEVANTSHDISALQSFAVQWQNLAKELTSTPDSISGAKMPSGTAYRQVAILNQEAHSLFEIMIENKALAIEDMMREYILPFLKTKMDTTDEISATLEGYGIEQLDSMYIKNEAIRRHNAKLVYESLNNEPGQPISGIDIPGEEDKIKQQLSEQGNQRFFKPSDIKTKTWKELFKDTEDEVEVEINGETSDKEAVMTTLTTLLQTVATNPMILQDPNMRMLFNEILETTGAISPIRMVASQNQTQTQNPANLQVGGGQNEKVGGDLKTNIK